MAAPLPPPLARRDETVVEELHGHRIADPYRWLEDPDAPATQAFVAAQNERFRAYLQQATFRDKARVSVSLTPMR
jgi:prolyl oligopeptidase